MTTQRQSTAAWIQQSLTDTEKQGSCFAIALVHYQGQQPTEIDRIAFPSTDKTVGECADRFDMKAREHARDLPGMQMFALLAFYGAAHEPGSTRPFSVIGTLQHPGLVSEAPTEAGLLQQAMRHSEISIQAAMGGIQQIVAGFRDLATAQREDHAHLVNENARLRVENAEAWVMVRNIGLQQRAEDHEQQMRLEKEKRTNLLITRLAKWGPALINTILGKKVFPQALEDTAIVEGLLSEMQPEHIALLGQIAPPEVMGLVSSRAKQIFAEREAAALEEGQARALARDAGPNAAEGELQ